MANTTLSVCTTSSDLTFGPQVEPCVRQFDFTLLFEDSILSILPSGLFILLFGLRIFQLSRTSAKVHSCALHIIKLLALAILGVLSLALLALQATRPLGRTTFSLAADACALFSILLLGVVSHLEHKKSVRPSLLIATYLSVTLALDAARLRSSWLQFGLTPSSILLTIELGTKIFLLIAEGSNKRNHLFREEKDISSEETGGLFNLGLFVWLLTLIRTGYRRVLLLDSLLPIDRVFVIDRSRARLSAIWNSTNLDRHKKYALTWATLRAFRRQFVAPIIPRLLLVGFTYSQPLLLNRVLTFLENIGGSGDNGANTGYGLIGAYFLVYTGFALSTAQYWHLTDRFITLTRGSLVAIIYEKSLTSDGDSHKDFSVMTLMSTDVERVVNGVKNMHETWAALLELALGLYLLETQIGIAWFTPLLVAIVISITVARTGPIASKNQKLWLEMNQRRIDITSSMLGSLKVIRMRGITDKVLSIIQRSRIIEVQEAGGFRNSQVLAVGQSYALTTMAPVLAFLVYGVHGSRTHYAGFSPATLFTALSLVQLSTRPAITTLTSIPAMLSALSCMSRIQEFLIIDDVLDCRVLADDNHQLNPKMTGKSTSFDTLPNKDTNINMSTLNPTLKNSTARAAAISVQNGSFGWRKHDQPVLRNINFEIKSRTVVMIVGPAGSGKSTLLKGLLGEALLLEGTVTIQSPKVAYVAQISWIRNGTVRENIIGVLDYNKNWYDAVVDMCALQTDFEQLTHGDQTNVGSKGSLLSGGQRQRLGLARAVYTKADIFILDDIFSSLDKTTTDQVFRSLSGPQGILHRLQATAIIVTHSVNLLPYADHVIALGQEGSIVEQNSFSELMEQQGYVHNIYSESQHANSSNETKEVAQHQASLPNTVIQSPTPNNPSSGASSTGTSIAYRFYLASFGRLNTAIFMLLSLAAAFCLEFPTVWLQMWTGADRPRAEHHWGFYLAMYAVIETAALLFICLGIWFYMSWMVAKSGKDLHLTMLETIGRASYSFLSNTDTGTILTRFSQDIMLIDTELPYAFLDASLNLLDCAIILVIVAVAAPYVAIAYPFLFAIMWFIQRVYLRTSSQLRLLELGAKGPLFTQFAESVDGLVTIRALGWQHELKKEQDHLIENSQKPFYLLLSIQRWLNLVMDLLVAGLAVLIVGLAIAIKSISPGFAGVALVNLIGLSGSLTSVITSWTKLETSLGAIFRIVNFCTDTPKESGDLEDKEAPKSWPTNGAIKFDNVVAAYDSESSPVLNGVTFNVNPGEKVGIFGRTGSGKSSLLNVLLRMIDLTDGTISIDGDDLEMLSKHQVRSRLICVPQELYLIPGDVRANLDIEGHNSDAEITEALDTVQLIDIIRKNGGLFSEMKSDMLSPGQAQLFSLARALLQQSRILILDEATSSVDIRTEKLMNQILRERFSTQTILAIVHRTASAKDYDKILVLDCGKVKAYGTYAEVSKFLPEDSD